MIKKKFIIIFVILIGFLILFYYRKNKIEKFELPTPTPTPTQYRLIDLKNSFLDGTTEKELDIDTIILQLHYNSNCSISHHFINGCCEELINISKNTIDLEKTYNRNNIFLTDETSATLIYGDGKNCNPNYMKHFKDHVNKPINPTIQLNSELKMEETNCNIDKSQSDITLYRNENTYMTDNKCLPVNYFQTKDGKKLCKMGKSSTLFYLIQILNFINNEYDELFDAPETLKYKNVDDRLIREGNSIDPKFYNMKIKFELIEGSTTPGLILKVPIVESFSSTRVVDIKYKDIDYVKNINNIDDIMNFLYKNVVINIDYLPEQPFKVNIDYLTDYEFTPPATFKEKTESLLYKRERKFTIEFTKSIIKNKANELYSLLYETSIKSYQEDIIKNFPTDYLELKKINAIIDLVNSIINTFDKHIKYIKKKYKGINRRIDNLENDLKVIKEPLIKYFTKDKKIYTIVKDNDSKIREELLKINEDIQSYIVKYINKIFTLTILFYNEIKLPKYHLDSYLNEDINNFIKTKYFEYKNELKKSTITGKNLPNPPFIDTGNIHYIDQDTIEKKMKIESKLHHKDEKMNYTHSRPRITWQDIPIISESGKDIRFLVLLLCNKDLEEQYNKDTKKKLIIWLAWNINIDLLSIDNSNYKVLDLKRKEPFDQLYPYNKAFDYEQSQFYYHDKELNPEGNFINDGNIIRTVNLQFKSYHLSSDQNDIIKYIYKRYTDEHKNIEKFYKEFIGYLDLPTNTISNTLHIPDRNDNFQYKVNETSNSYLSLYIDKNNLFKEKQITLFNYGNISYSLEINKDTTILLPKNTYWEITYIKDDLIKETISDAIDYNDFYGDTNAPSSNEESLFKRNYGSDDDDLILTVNGYDKFSVVDGNYTFRLPYKTDRINMKSSKKTNYIIKEADYLTRRVIWFDLIKDKSVIKKVLKNGIVLEKGKIINIKIILTQKVNYYLSLACTDGIQINGSLGKEKEEFHTIGTDKFYVKSANLNVIDLNIVTTKESTLYNGSVTFFSKNFNIQEYKKNQVIEQYNFGKSRIKEIKMNSKSTCMARNVSQQIMPSFSWNTDFKEEDKVKYALEIYYMNKEGKQTVYLEWNIDVNETSLNYEIFKNNRNNIKITELENAKDISSFNNVNNIQSSYIFTTLEKTNIDENSKTINGKKYYNLKNKDCEVIEDYKLLDKKGSKPIKIKIVSPDLGNRNTYLSRLSDKDFTKTSDNFELFTFKKDNKRYELKYNQNLERWQIWVFDTQLNLLEWIATQKDKINIFNQDTKWIFSPKHKKGFMGTYDFFDYPNEFKQDKIITKSALNKTQEVILNITGSELSKNIIDCSVDKTELLASSIGDIKSYEPLDFTNTLFNIPSVSEMDKDSKMIKIEEPKMDESGIYYNLELRAKIHVYKENVDKDMSNLIKNHYILDKIKDDVLENPDLINVKPLLLDEILVNRGDLKKLPFQDKIKSIININDFGEMENTVPGKMPVINENIKISNDIVKEFNKYINNPVTEKLTPSSVLHKDYSSYGPLKLRQSESIINYKIPIDLPCLIRNLDDNIIYGSGAETHYKIAKAQFYKVSATIRFLLEIKQSDSFKDIFKSEPLDTRIKIDLADKDDISDNLLKGLDENLPPALTTINDMETDFINKIDYDDTVEDGKVTKTVNQQIKEKVDDDESKMKKVNDLSYFNTIPRGKEIDYNFFVECDEETDCLAAPSQTLSITPVTSDTEYNQYEMFLMLLKKIKPILVLYNIMKNYYDNFEPRFNLLKQDVNLESYLMQKINFLQSLNSKINKLNQILTKEYEKIYKEPPKSAPITTTPIEIDELDLGKKDMNPAQVVSYYKNIIFDIFKGE